MGPYLRAAALALLATRLVLASGNAVVWVVGPIQALATGALVAFAIVTERRAWLRRLMLVAVSAGFAAYVFHYGHLGHWHTRPSPASEVVYTLVEAAILIAFVETRLWRVSVIPGVVLFFWLAFHVLPGGYGFSEVYLRRAAWLSQALLLLLMNGGRRAMREEDEQHRRALVR